MSDRMLDLMAAEVEFTLNLDLNQQYIVDVPCSCGASHPNIAPMSAEQKRTANRDRVAWQSNVAAYLAADGTSDAWKFRTLNLDGMMVNGRI